MSLLFTPPKEMGKYALYVESDYKPFFKVYNDLGHAKNAARRRTRSWGSSTVGIAAKILEMVDGEWYVLYDIPKGSEDFPWVKDVPVRWTSRTVRRARPMTRDEYAAFRVKVFAEKHLVAA